MFIVTEYAALRKPCFQNTMHSCKNTNSGMSCLVNWFCCHSLFSSNMARVHLYHNLQDSWENCMTSIFRLLWFQDLGKNKSVWASTLENLFSGFAINKGTDQPAPPHRLISTFFICSLKSIISRVRTGLKSTWIYRKSLKIKFILKSTGKSLKILEKSLKFYYFLRTWHCG